MTDPVITPFAAWSSPISAALAASAQVNLAELLFDGDVLHVIEGRPQEGGRHVLLRLSESAGAVELTPAPWSVRTRVHEYGGGAAVMADGIALFSHFGDQRLYRLAPGAAPVPLTPAPPQADADPPLRYADGCIDRGRRRWIGVREEHRAGGAQAVSNTIVAVDLDRGGAGEVLVQGSDFYAAPRLSPDGRQLAWLSWKHPHMPWESSALWVAQFDGSGQLRQARQVAGGAQESIFQPEWAPDGALCFVSDRSGWWNIHRSGRDGGVASLCPMAAEFGRAQWALGMSSYAFLSANELVCSYVEAGMGKLARLELASGRLTPYALPFGEFASLRVGGGQVAFKAGAPDIAAQVVLLDPQTGRWRTLRQSTTLLADEPALAACLSTPKAIEFPSAGGRSAHALFYPPRNPAHAAPAGELPPLVVKCHGGPTSSAARTLDWRTQFWTSRGVAVVDVDYGGSTGYGRAYRERLHGRWGVVDVEDCAAAARHLGAQGLADAGRMVITGNSAGGFTALGCLTSADPAIRGLFKAGGSHYGVSDPLALAQDTHKFESRYLDWLIAPPADAPELYRERSPLRNAERLCAPVAFFQGAQDRIVPPEQTEAMVAALRRKGLTAQYLLFAGEQHGFRQSTNIRWALDAEFYFYRATAFGRG